MLKEGKKRRGKLMILPLEIKTITLVFWNYFSFLPHVEVECYERCLWGGCSSSVIALHVIRVHVRIRNVEHHRQLPDVITHGIIYKTIHQQINFPYFLIKRFSKIFRRRRQRTEKTLFFDLLISEGESKHSGIKRLIRKLWRDYRAGPRVSHAIIILEQWFSSDFSN